MSYGFRRRKYTVTEAIGKTTATPPVYPYIETWIPATQITWLDVAGQNVKVIEVNRNNALNVTVLRYDSGVEDLTNLDDQRTATKARRLVDADLAETEVCVFDLGSLITFDGTKLIRMSTSVEWVGTATDFITRVYTSSDDVNYTLYSSATGGGGISIHTTNFSNCRYIKVTVEASGVSGGGAYLYFSEPLIYDLSTPTAESSDVSEVTHNCITSNDYMTIIITADTDVTYSAHYIDKTTYTEDEIEIREV